MNRTAAKAVICFLLLCVAVSATCGAKIELKDPIRLPDDQLLKTIYFFPHWWDPWKSDDAAVTADLHRMRELGFNTVCVDHEASQAVDREWYWLDREYELARQENMCILPWLQLQSADRVSLMQFSHLELERAVNQDGQPEEDSVLFRDGEFKKALAHYVSVYLDRYGSDPTLLRVKEKDKLRPVVGLMVETGWRSTSGLPLSFDEETNAYFQRWMKASYHDLEHLNSEWGTSYKSFDEIDPCDKTIFNYAFEDKNNMPVAVREHTRFRARIISDALRDVARQVKKRYKDVLFAAEAAYPFSLDNQDANVYRWNNANEYKAVEFADIIFIRTVGNTSSGQVKKEQDLMMLNGKRVVLAYRLFDDSSSSRAVAFGLDCASAANGLGYYNWNETADGSSAIYDKPDSQALAGLMTSTYDMLYDPDSRHEMASTVLPPPRPEAVTTSEPPATTVEAAPAEPVEPSAESSVAPAPVPASPAPAEPTAEPSDAESSTAP